MAKVRALIAEGEQNLLRIVSDILEMTFKDVEVDWALSSETLLQKLREDGRAYDLVLYDLHLDELPGGDALPVIRAELPDILDRLIVLADKVDEVRRNEHARDVPYAIYPFSLDDFTDTVERVYERRKAALAEERSDPPQD